jgi:hypothetical protein
MGAQQTALTAGDSTPESLSSIPEDERSPVVKRLAQVIGTLNNFVIENGDGNLSRYAFIMQALTDEVIEELTDKEEPIVAVFMEQMGEVIAWIGHGDDSRLPDQLLPFVAQMRPELEAVPD